MNTLEKLNERIAYYDNVIARHEKFLKEAFENAKKTFASLPDFEELDYSEVSYHINACIEDAEKVRKMLDFLEKRVDELNLLKYLAKDN